MLGVTGDRLYKHVTSLSDTDWTRLARHFAGDATPEEIREIERWMAESPDNARATQVLREAWEVRRPAPFIGNSEVLWVSLGQMMRADTTLTDASEAPPSHGQGIEKRVALKPMFVRNVLYVRPQTLWASLTAAVVAIAAVIVIGWDLVGHRMTSQPSAAVSTYATNNAQRADIILPDGNTVLLNVASRLDVPADYLTGNHNLRLSGQALFTVVHHDRTPFTVIAGTTTSRVLGTSFTMRHYSTDTSVTVAVRDGKVGVRSTVLTASQQVDISPTGRARIRSAMPSQFAFTTGVLTIEGVTLRDAVAELDRWYDTDIRLGSPSLGDQHLTGTLPAGSLADLTALLELTFDVRVVREGRVLTLYAR